MLNYRGNGFLEKEKEKAEKTKRSEQSLNKNIYAFQLRDCPPSLKLIVQVFRVFGFSFSGVTFASQQPKIKNNETLQSPPTKSPLPSFSSLGLFFIALNLLHIIKEMILLPLYQTLHDNQQKITLQLKGSHSPPGDSFNISLPSLEKFEHPLDELKPILGFVMRSTLYVNMGTAVGVYVHNLLFGGRLVRLMVSIPRAGQKSFHDEDRSLALTLFRYLFIFLLLLYAFSLNAYNSHLIWHFISWLLGFNSVRPTQQQWQVVASLSLVLSIHLSLHIVACFTSVVFVYIMATFRRHITALKRSLQLQEGQQKPAIDEAALLRLKGQIEQLSAHFHLVIGNQAFPLTLTIVTDIWTVVGTFCFLMVRQNRSTDSEGEHQMTFVFNFAVLTFTRLCVICSAGNAATNAYSSLLRSLFERMSANGGACAGSQWTLNQWLYFREIKLLKQQFKVVIGTGTYCIKQSALLSMLAFILNYIIVLLQTQEFGSNSHFKKSS